MKHIRRFNDTNELKTCLNEGGYIEPWLSYCNNDNENNTLYKYNYQYNFENFIDLGFPSRTLWAPYNLGATNIYQPGDPYAWGEIISKTDSSWANYKFGTQTNLTKYNTTDNITVLEESDDIVTLTLGPGFHIPTAQQITELHNNTSGDYSKIDSDGIVILTSEINGKSIYFKLYNGKMTWSSTVATSNKSGADGLQMKYESGAWGRNHSTFYRWTLMPVRPVIEMVK